MKAHRRTGLGPKDSIRVFAFWSLTALALLMASKTAAAEKLCSTIYVGAVTIDHYSGPGGVVEIPSTSNGLPVRVIADSAFWKRDDITSIILPETVRVVSEGAFSGRTNLTNVTLPMNLARIQNKTFSGCSNLTSITIPPNVLSIGEEAFRNCAMLTNVVFLGSRVGSIGRYAFAGCARLKQITLPAYIDAISDYTFEGCSQLDGVVIPESVVSIGASAFYGCTALTNLNIPEGVISIGYNAFAGCSRLKSITTAAPYIQKTAFSGCTDLTQLTLLHGVVKIDSGAFQGLSKLTSLFVPDSLTSINSSTFSGLSRLTNVFLPDGVRSIAPGAFSGCTSLASVTTGATNIGDFTGCPKLKAFYCTGNAPGLSGYIPGGTVYYLPWTTGWKQTLGGRPTAVWQPRLKSSNAGVAAKTNQFGFNIQWASGAEAKVDACVDLANPDWIPVATNTVGSDGLAYFTDPDSTNYPTRFYRVRWP